MVATTLDVVNDCLAIMGEAPLNTIAEDHAFKQAALTQLDRNNRNIQAQGWWFNQELLTIAANPLDNRLYLPNDAGSFIVLDRTKLDEYAQRGRVIYNLSKGTDIFSPGFSLKVQLIRQLAFEDLPNSANAFIAGKSVLDFQLQYDGDSTKTRELKGTVYGFPTTQGAEQSRGLYGELNAEHIRNKRFNFIQNSERLSRITCKIDYSRRPR